MNFLSQLQFFKVIEIMTDETRVFDAARAFPDKVTLEY